MEMKDGTKYKILLMSINCPALAPHVILHFSFQRVYIQQRHPGTNELCVR